MAAAPASPTKPTPKTQKRFDITLAGETNLDLILYGLPQDLPVERELLASGLGVTLGGSSSILAHNLAILGSRTGFVTLFGRDDLGAIAHRRLLTAGVDLSHAAYRDDKQTGLTVLLHHGAKRHILTYLGVMEDMAPDDLSVDYLADAHHFHLSSLFLQPALQPGLPALFSYLKDRGLTLSLDTNDDPADKWGGGLDELLDLIDVLLPNEDEICRMTGKPTLEAALDALHRVPIVVVKCGARGAIVQQAGVRTAIDPYPVTPVDTIGAGDSFNAGFLHAYAQGQDAVTAARLATRTGALSTQKTGGTEAFLDAALRAQFLGT